MMMIERLHGRRHQDRKEDHSRTASKHGRRRAMRVPRKSAAKGRQSGLP
jgi:hypothetical protein